MNMVNLQNDNIVHVTFFHILTQYQKTFTRSYENLISNQSEISISSILTNKKTFANLTVNR